MRSEGWQIEYEQNLGNVRLSPTAETALFRVTQEALTNVRRHAHTTRAHVSLERQDKTVRLRVRDHGQGFQLPELESESGPGERVGLSSMRERVALLGGNFEVRSQSGTGTSITVEIPLTERGELRK
jgi:signal transduction histidine kinase